MAKKLLIRRKIKKLVKPKAKPVTMMTVTVPSDVAGMHITGYPDGHPNGPYRVEMIRKGKDSLWMRGHGKTIQEAFDNMKNIRTSKSKG